jgi:hypothetical protein
MRCAVALLALLILGSPAAAADSAAQASPAPSTTPQSESADPTVESDPTTTVKTINIQATYTGASYGPGNLHLSQVIPRIAAFRIGKSLLRLSLPRVQTINGVDSGFSDTQLFYLLQRPTRAGIGFVGLFAQFPTATSRFFGTGKWLIGPAAAYIFAYRPRQLMAGVLLQSAFSVAGAANRANQSALTILPFGTFTIGHGWYLKLAEGPWAFDLQRGATIIPLGLGIGRVGRIDNDPLMIAISDEATVIHANAVNAPKNTIRLTFTVVVRSGSTPEVP